MVQLDEISKSIGNLEGTITEGFKGIDKHFEILNGKIAEQEKRINRNETLIDENKGVMKLVGGIAVFVGSIITIAVQWAFRKIGE